MNAIRHKSSPPVQLYGRKKFLAEVVSLLQSDTEAAIIALTGKSGVGKTAFLNQLAENCRSADGTGIIVQHQVESQAYSVQHFLGMLTVQIIEQGAIPKRHFAGFRESLNRISRDHAIALATAGLIDVTANLAPTLKRTTESLLSVLSQTDALSAPKATAETIVRKSNDDLLAAYIRLIDSMAQSGFRGVLLLDQVEHASQGVLDALIAILRGLPNKWGLCLAINDELPEGLNALTTILPPMKYRGGTLRELPGLDIGALEAWTQDIRGQLPATTELARVLENCGGRPLFLRDWVHGLTTVPERSLHTKLGAYYDQRLRALSSESRRLLRALALLPANTRFPFDLCHAFLSSGTPGKTTDFVLDILTELQDKHLIEHVAGTNESYRLVHELTRNHVYEGMPHSVVRSTAISLYEVLRKAAPSMTDVRERLNYLIVVDLAERNELMREIGLQLARDFLASGSYEAARSAYQLCLRSLDRSSGSSEDIGLRASARMGLATVFVHTGYYEESLSELQQLDESLLSGEDKTNVKLIRAEANLRLNRYEDADSEACAARLAAATIGRLDLELEGERIINTILRDRGEYNLATRQAEDLVKRAIAAKVPQLILCGCYRSLARSLALEASDLALIAARSALSIAETEGSVRAKGGSYLAMAEACRHTGTLDDAEHNYGQAIEIGELLSNRDLILWATLGLADSFTLRLCLSKALSALDSISELVQGGHSRHPLEHVHWKLSVETISYLKDPVSNDGLAIVVEHYRKLNVYWPQQYVTELLNGKRPPSPKLL